MNYGNKRIRVLVVDDSAYLRKAISEMLTSSPNIDVVATAWDGEDALEKVEEYKPDVVTLDLYMPGLDGIGFLRKQMDRRPLPVIVVSVAEEGEEKYLSALEAGAVEFVRKPTSRSIDKMYDISEELVQKVTAAAGISPQNLTTSLKTLPLVQVKDQAPQSKSLFDVVVIGISTGGPNALRFVLSSLPEDFPVPIAIVLHMPEGYTGPFAQRLDQISKLNVLEAADGLELLPGRAVLAQAGYHMVLRKLTSGIVAVHLDKQPSDLPHRPSVDILFHSAADVYRERTLGVVMTGMGNDGILGAAWIKNLGGKIVTQDKESCVVYGMPRAVTEAGLSDKIISLQRMPEAILEAVTQ